MEGMENYTPVPEEKNEDFESVRERRIAELDTLLRERQLKQLQEELENTDEFEVAEFLATLPQHQMAKVFRMLTTQWT